MSSVQRPHHQASKATRHAYTAVGSFSPPEPQQRRPRQLNDLPEEEEHEEERISRLFPKCTPKSTPTNTPTAGKANRTLSDSLQQQAVAEAAVTAEKKIVKKKKKKKKVPGKKAGVKEPHVAVDKIIDLDEDIGVSKGGVQQNGGNVGTVSSFPLGSSGSGGNGDHASVAVHPSVFHHDVHKMLSPTSTYAPQPLSAEPLTPLQHSTRIPLSTSDLQKASPAGSNSSGGNGGTSVERRSTKKSLAESQLCDTKIEIAGE